MSSALTSRSADVRLLLPLLTVWSGCLGGFGLGGDQTLLVVVAGGLATSAFAMYRTLAHAGFIVCLLLIGLGLSWGQWRVTHDPMNAEIFEQMPVGVMTFVVRSDPSSTTAHGFSSLTFSVETRFVAQLISVNDRSVHIPVAVSVSGSEQHLRITEVWSCNGAVRPAAGVGRVAGFLQCRGAPSRVAPASRYQNIATGIREGLAAISVGRHPLNQGAQLLPGLVVGDTSSQSTEVTRALQIAGLGHLTAVSGANVAIVVAALAWLLKWTRFPLRWRYVFLLCGVLGFMIVARPSASVVRASLMAAIALTLWVTGSHKRAEVVVLATGLVLLIVDPWLAISWGFALSLAATLGLIVLPRLWGVGADNPWWQRWLATATAACLATAPLLVAMGAAPTLATIPANIVAEVLVAPATIFGVAAALLVSAGLWPLATVVADAGCVCANGIVRIAVFFSESPMAVSMLSWQVLSLLALLIFLWHQRHLKLLQRMAVAVLGLCLVLLMQLALTRTKVWPPADWEMMVCDVGQGDGALIRTGEHSAIVVDAGADADVIDSCLDTAGVRAIDLFVASHFHQDHVGGIAGLFRDGRIVGQILTSAYAQPAMGKALVEQTAHLPLVTASTGMTGHFGDVFWEVLMALNPDGESETDGTTINSSSIVLLVTTAHWRIMFTGDIETAAQNEFMSTMSPPVVDLVKVPHHGSRSQAPGFAEWVHASLAWVSVGADNPYGHPNSGTLSAFRRIGTSVLLTQDCGALAVTAQHTIVTERRCSGG